MNTSTHESLNSDPFSRTAAMIEDVFERTKDADCISSVRNELKTIKGIFGLTRKEKRRDMREIAVEPNQRLVVSRIVITPFMLGRPRPPQTEFVIKCLPGFEVEDDVSAELPVSRWTIGTNGHITFSGERPGSDEERRRGPLPPDSLIYPQELNNICEQLERIVKQTA